MSEKFKFVDIKGRKFRITKFKALKAGAIIMKLSGVLSPIAAELMNMDFSKFEGKLNLEDFDGVNLKDALGDFNVPGILAAFGKITEEDFEYLQGKCLMVCYEELPAGPTAVLSADGSLGVIGLDDDPATLLALTVHTLFFNMKGFFDGSPLASIFRGLLTTSQRGS